VTLAKSPHRPLGDPHPPRSAEVLGQFRAGPVCPIETAPSRPFLDPGEDFLCELSGDPRRRAFGPVDAQPLHTAPAPCFQPPSDRPLVDPEVHGDLGLGAPASDHQDGLSPVAKASILRGLENLLEVFDFPMTEIQVRHSGRT